MNILSNICIETQFLYNKKVSFTITDNREWHISKNFLVILIRFLCKTIFPHLQLFSHTQNYFPTLKIIFPRLQLFSHTDNDFPTNKIIFPRSKIFSHIKNYFPTLTIIFPHSKLFSQTHNYFPILTIIFPLSNYFSMLNFFPSFLDQWHSVLFM